MWEQTRDNPLWVQDEQRRELAMRYAEDVYRYAFARLGSREDAEDVTMEVVQAALGDQSLAKNRLLLLRNARNRVIDRWRRKKSVSELVDQADATVLSSDLDLVIQINQALTRLNEDHADFLVLKYVHGLSAREIGKVTGKTFTAVNSALQRAREEFKRIAPELRPDNGEDDER